MLEVGNSVLFVGGDAMDRGFLTDTLCRKGYKVYNARSAKEGKKGLDMRPGLVVVDQRLRGTSGLAWLRCLRDGGYDVPVIFCLASMCSVTTFNELRNLLKVSMIVWRPIETARLLDQIESLKGRGEVAGYIEQAKPGPMPSSMPGTMKDNQDQSAISAGWQEELEAERETRAALAALGRQYLADMPETLYTLRMHLETALIGEDCGPAMKESRVTAHRIKGTAGSFGFTEFSQLAGEIENHMKAGGEGDKKYCIAQALLIIARMESWLEAWLDENRPLLGSASGDCLPALPEDCN